MTFWGSQFVFKTERHCNKTAVNPDTVHGHVAVVFMNPIFVCSSTVSYQLKREQAKCLHCQGNHDSAGHEGLKEDVAMIKTEQH